MSWIVWRWLAVDWLDARNVQQVAVDHVSGKSLAGLRQANNRLSLGQEHHFGLPHFVRRPIGEMYEERLEWLPKEVLLNCLWSHGLALNWEFAIVPRRSQYTNYIARQQEKTRPGRKRVPVGPWFDSDW
jgi:hypothetical protein